MYLIIDLFFKKNLKMVQITLTLSVLVQSADSQLHYDYPPPYNNYIQVDKPVQNIYNEPHYGYDYNMDQQRFGYDNKNCMCSCDNCKQPSICCVEACSQCLMYPTTKLIMYVTYPMMIITKLPYATKSNEKSTTTEPKTQDKDQEQETKTTSIKETTRNPPTQDQDQEKETKTTSIEETKPPTQDQKHETKTTSIIEPTTNPPTQDQDQEKETKITSIEETKLPTQDQEHETKTTSIEKTTTKPPTQDEENVVQTTSIEETTTKLPTQDQENETQTTSIDETTTKPPTQDQDQKEQIEPTDTRRFFRRLWLPTIDKTEPQGKKEIGDITLQKLMFVSNLNARCYEVAYQRAEYKGIKQPKPFSDQGTPAIDKEPVP